MAIYQYKIAVGYNAATLTNVEDLVGLGESVKMYPPSAFSAYDPGTPRTRLDGLAYNTGFTSVAWQFRSMTRGQYFLLKEQYCIAGGWAGTVSIQTRDQSGTYVKYNAIMNLPFNNELQRNFTRYTDVQVQFIRLNAYT